MSYIGMHKPIANIWKTVIQVQNHHTSCTGMSTIFMGGKCHKTCEVGDFKWRVFYENLIQIYDESNDILYILEVDVDYRKEFQ